MDLLLCCRFCDKSSLEKSVNNREVLKFLCDKLTLDIHRFCDDDFPLCPECHFLYNDLCKSYTDFKYYIEVRLMEAVNKIQTVITVNSTNWDYLEQLDNREEEESYEVKQDPLSLYRESPSPTDYILFPEQCEVGNEIPQSNTSVRSSCRKQSLDKEITESEVIINEDILVKDEISVEVKTDVEEYHFQSFIQESQTSPLQDQLSTAFVHGTETTGSSLQPISEVRHQKDSNVKERKEHFKKRQTKGGKRCKSTHPKTFVCEICGKGFSTRSILKTHHEKIHERKHIIQCELCEKQSASKKGHEKHMKSHTQKREHVCYFCAQRFLNPTALREHVYRHTLEKPIPCPFCPERFCQSHLLTTHLIKKHDQRKVKSKNNEANLVCNICGQVGFTRQNLKHHIAGHNRSKEFACELCAKVFRESNSLVRHSIILHEQPSTEEEKTFSCFKCLKKFRTRWMLERHIGFHRFEHRKPLSCDICDARFHKEEHEKLSRHKMRCLGDSIRINFQCTYCSKTVKGTSPMALRRHERKYHLEQFPHICNQCGKKYSEESLLETHLNTHKDEGPFNCIFCAMLNKKITKVSADTLAKHLQTHTGEIEINKKQVYNCPQCPALFHQKIELTRHTLTQHEPDKQLCCELCPKRFPFKYQLKKHLVRHENLRLGITLPRKFFCEICGHGFCTQRNLKKHCSNVHERKFATQCDICGKILSSKKSLEMHLKSHNQIRDHVCYFCGQRFIRADAMKTHINRHTLEKPFGCSHCPQRFTQAHCLKTHLKKHDEPSSNP